MTSSWSRAQCCSAVGVLAGQAQGGDPDRERAADHHDAEPGHDVGLAERAVDGRHGQREARAPTLTAAVVRGVPRAATSSGPTRNSSTGNDCRRGRLRARRIRSMTARETAVIDRSSSGAARRSSESPPWPRGSDCCRSCAPRSTTRACWRPWRRCRATSSCRPTCARRVGERAAAAPRRPDDLAAARGRAHVRAARARAHRPRARRGHRLRLPRRLLGRSWPRTSGASSATRALRLRARRLSAAGVDNVTLVVGDGVAGAAGAGAV